MDTNLSFEERAKDLVSQMTLEEKVYQTLHGAQAIDRLDVKAYNYWNEALHGVARAGTATVFPQAIGMAAAFDEDLIAKVGEVVSDEGRAKFNANQKYGDYDIYKGLTFWSPNVNIFRDPRWGRGHETFGEDPYLTSRLGVRFIEAMQGDDDKYLKVAACAKHFAVHSGPEDERHSFDAVASTKDMRETYLPAFKACVKEADVEVVMGAYNRTNGEPCCGSKALLKDILRDEWGFKGHVTSDCWAIKDFHEFHMVTDGPVESVALAMNMGCDLNCGNIYGNLLKAVEQGLVSEETITTAVERLFVTRMKLGLFDPEDAVKYNKIDYSIVDCNKHRDFNEEVAAKTVCLLKNDGILPLKKSDYKTIGIIGPNANNIKALVGNYEGTSSEYITVLDGIRRYVGDDVRILYSEGCHLCKDRVQGLAMENDRISEVRAVCDESDIVIACLGLDASLEGEEGDEGNEFASGDKPNLNLPGLQKTVFDEIIKSGKKCILVMLSGSALAVPYADKDANAVLQGWYPGARGGLAIAKLLFGEYNPCGKLPVTFYNTSEEIPDFHDYSMENRTYRYMKNKALYPFGYGLSYTNFEVSDAKADSNEIKNGSKINVNVNIKNTGDIFGEQTVQVYVKRMRDDAPNCQLKGLKKIGLNPGESKSLSFELTDDAFGLYNDEGNKILEKGDYKVFVGMSQPDERSVELMGVAPLELDIVVNDEDSVVAE